METDGRRTSAGERDAVFPGPGLDRATMRHGRPVSGNHGGHWSGRQKKTKQQPLPPSTPQQAA